MLGPKSDWVKNVQAANGEVVIHQGFRHLVHLVPVRQNKGLQFSESTCGSHQMAEYISQYRLVSAALSEFERIAEFYPVYRIDPA